MITIVYPNALVVIMHVLSAHLGGQLVVVVRYMRLDVNWLQNRED